MRVTLKQLTVRAILNLSCFHPILARQMGSSNKENQPRGDIHHHGGVTTRLFICLSVGCFLNKYMPQAHENKIFCPIFTPNSLCK